MPGQENAHWLPNQTDSEARCFTCGLGLTARQVVAGTCTHCGQLISEDEMQKLLAQL